MNWWHYLNAFKNSLEDLEINSVYHSVYYNLFADAFIQSDLQCIQAIHFFCQYVFSLGIEPTTFCTSNAMLYHWATGAIFVLI